MKSIFKKREHKENSQPEHITPYEQDYLDGYKDTLAKVAQTLIIYDNPKTVAINGNAKRVAYGFDIKKLLYPITEKSIDGLVTFLSASEDIQQYVLEIIYQGKEIVISLNNCQISDYTQQLDLRKSTSINLLFLDRA